MPKVSEALRAFLSARKTPANADLIDRWGVQMETQVNVAAGNGEPVGGKRSTWSNGTEEWFNIRIPQCQLGSRRGTTTTSPSRSPSTPKGSA